MKVKHILGLHFILILGLFLWGCTLNTDLDRKIRAWQERYPNRTGDCMIYAMKQVAYYQENGVKARICHGRFKGERHAWCEYYDNKTKTWLVDDPAIWYIGKGYPREAYKSNGKCDYELIYWGETQRKGEGSYEKS